MKIFVRDWNSKETGVILYLMTPVIEGDYLDF